ncbi:hypothetical protein LZ32DRAFT_688702 [Colletotrichum eremochloae]|nr:hypothetical protein LZ32DRAFT_688702 [Colletotrichum eremochloae]
MKSSALIIVFSILYPVSGSYVARRGLDCKDPGNNCQRGVNGTAGINPPLSSRLADCSLLNRVTVTPSPVTEIVTETSTTGTIFIPTILVGAEKRSVETEATTGGSAVTLFPSIVPTYATYCADAANYFSACGCAGVMPVTTTAPTPTVTLTTTELVEQCYGRQVVRRGMKVMNEWMNTGLA